MDFISQIRIKYHTGRYRIVNELIKENGRNLLDIGCGKPCRVMEDGSFLRFIGYGTGIDVHDMNIPFPFKIGSIMDIPFPDNSFDVVTALEVIEHIEDVDKALMEIKRVLKPKGVLILTTPNTESVLKFLWPIWFRTIGREWLDTHMVEFRKNILFEALSQHFEIKKFVLYVYVDFIVKMNNVK